MSCFDIGTLQAFLDGETNTELSAQIAAHTSECDVCAQNLASAEEETSMVFAALDRELSALVPSQRLWSKINSSISEEKRSNRFWQPIYSLFTAPFINPVFSGAAGVVLIFAVVGLLWSFGPGLETEKGNIAGLQNEKIEMQTDKNDMAKPVVTTNIGETGYAVSEKKAVPAGDTSKSGLKNNLGGSAIFAKTEGRNTSSRKRAFTHEKFSPQVVKVVYIPGEESYIKTIAELERTVNDHKDSVLSPTSRVAYERDMAVVNDAIMRMQKFIRKNPANQAARQVLYSAYQDKIDLLNSVGQREELLASLR